jgi:hypothetical protein
MLNDNYERSSDPSWKDVKTAVQEIGEFDSEEPAGFPLLLC